MLDPSVLKDFTDDKFKFGENGRKFSKSLENTVGNGEIAQNEQFLLFSQCFQKTYTVFLAVFSKDIHSRHVKRRACLGKS